MLDAIRFARGAISDKAKVLPVLSHFYIHGEHLQGSDGRMWIQAPCPELKGVSAVVPAERFLRAVDTCDGEPVIRFTDTGRMVVERKPFRSTLPVLPVDSYPYATATKGARKKIGTGLMETLRALHDFLSTDAERMWATAVLFHNDVAYATNSAMIGMVRTKCFAGLELKLPIYVIDEILRIGTPPDTFAMDDASMTFFWPKEIGWLRATPITAEWPVETAKKWLATKMSGLVDIPQTLAASIARVLPFCNDPKFPIIYFSEKGISTAQGEVQAEIAGFKLGVGAFRADNLQPMLAQSDKMIITDKAALFTGPNAFRGVMAPLRVGV